MSLSTPPPSGHAFIFDRKKHYANILLKRVRQKHAFEETRQAKDKNDELAQFWDEDPCDYLNYLREGLVKMPIRRV